MPEEHLIDNPLDRIRALEIQLSELQRNTPTNIEAIGGVTDHGSLTGLGDDDHTQYSLVAGTRAFTGTVGGVTPVAASDLATKNYVDTVPWTDHGSLTGLGDDDHAQYVHISVARTITAQHTFAPGSPQAPFVLGANAQDQTVVGLDADSVDGYDLNQGVQTTDSPTFAGLTVNGSITVTGLVDGVDVANHDHSGVGEGGTVAHTSLGSVTADQHHTALVGLAGDSGTAVPDGSDYIVIAGGTGIDTVAATSTVTVTHGTGDFGDLHTNYAEHDQVETISALWTFNAGATIAAGQNLNFGADVSLTRSGADVLALGSGDAFQSSTFVSGASGWEVTEAGNAEFWNVRIRGELHASVFVMDEFHVDGGTRILGQGASSVGDPKVGGDNVTAGSVGSNFTLVVNDRPSGAAQIFDVGNAIRVKFWNGTSVYDIWCEIVSYSDNGDGTGDYVVTLRSGSTGVTIPAATGIAEWGADGDGLIFETVDQTSSPYYDVRTVNASPWSTADTVHVRLGNLDGIGGIGAEYGMIAGKDLSDLTEAHVIVSDQQVGLFGVAQEWWRSDGTKMAELDPTVSGTSVLFGAGPDVDTGDYQFKILANGDVWLSTLAISDDMGQMFFSQADGLALWGPGCEIDPTLWASTRGQTAVISGAFHQEMGRWVGTRGLVIEPGTTNLDINPVFREWTGSVPTGWLVVNSATVSQNTDSAYIRDDLYSVKIVNNVSSADRGIRKDFTGLTVGQECTVTVWAYLVGTRADLIVFDGGGFSNGVRNTITGAGWHRFEVQKTVPVGGGIRVVLVSHTLNGTVYFDDVQVEDNQSYSTTFCWGGAGVGYSWSGTAHASASTRVATQINMDSHAALLDGNDEFSISLWWQAPYDYDGVWPESTNNYLFNVYEDATNQLRVVFLNGTNEIEAYYSSTGFSALVTHQLAFSAGDWIHIVVNVDTAGDLELEIDGVIRDSSDLSSASSISPTQMNLGSNYAASAHAGGVYSELAIFDRVLTADEIAALYSRGTPMVDAGSLETPGLYIYDGKIRVMSSTTGKHTEIVPAGIGIYEDTGPTGVGRILGGFVDTTAKELDVASDDLGWFGYDSSDDLQVVWYASGDDAGKIVAGGGVVTLDENGVGITVDTTEGWIEGYKFTDGTDWISGLQAYKSASDNVLLLAVEKLTGRGAKFILNVDSDAGHNAEMTLGIKYDGGIGPVIYLFDDGTNNYGKFGYGGFSFGSTIGSVNTDGEVWIEADLRVDGGVSIGDVAYDPEASTLYIASGSTASTPTGGAVFYSVSGEMWVKDTGGNATQLSPHNFDLIPDGPSERGAWSFYGVSPDGDVVNVDMMRAVRLVEELSGQSLVFINRMEASCETE